MKEEGINPTSVSVSTDLFVTSRSTAIGALVGVMEYLWDELSGVV